MAKAIFEKRQFTNRQNGGEIVDYEFYGIQGIDSTGEMNELRLQNLNSAEKIAFRMLASMESPVDTSNMNTTIKSGGSVEVTKNEEDDKQTNWLKD